MESVKDIENMMFAILSNGSNLKHLKYSSACNSILDHLLWNTGSCNYERIFNWITRFYPLACRIVCTRSHTHTHMQWIFSNEYKWRCARFARRVNNVFHPTPTRLCSLACTQYTHTHTFRESVYVRRFEELCYAHRPVSGPTLIIRYFDATGSDRMFDWICLLVCCPHCTTGEDPSAQLLSTFACTSTTTSSRTKNTGHRFRLHQSLQVAEVAISSIPHGLLRACLSIDNSASRIHRDIIPTVTGINQIRYFQSQSNRWQRVCSDSAERSFSAQSSHSGFFRVVVHEIGLHKNSPTNTS